MDLTAGIIGDAQPTELPEVQIDDASLIEARKMAKFSQSEEFKRLKEHIEERIAFYQQCQPNGKQIGEDLQEVALQWVVANSIIAELRTVISAYENAAEVVKEAAQAAKAK